LATVTAVAAMAAGSTLATRAAIAALSATATAGGIEMSRAADRIDVVDHVAAGHGGARQWDHRRSQKHTGDRAESRRTTAMSQHVARLAVSLPIGHLLASRKRISDYAHSLSSWANSLLSWFRTGS
jgi:hypothetical protein